MAYLDREGVKIYYEVAGEGPTLLLSHGYSATSQMWREQMDALKNAYRVIAWDMRGHGESDSPEDQSLYSEAHTIEDMKGLLDECGADRAVVGGLSLGGYMSLAFKLKYPDIPTALMLFDTGPGFKKDEARDKWNERAEQWGSNLESKGLAAIQDMGGTEMRAAMHRSAEGLARAARGMLRQYDSRIMASLPDVDVPTLVLVGADDTPFLAATDYMEHKIADAKKVVIPDAGHSSNLDQPEAFNAAVEEFLAGL